MKHLKVADIRQIREEYVATIGKQNSTNVLELAQRYAVSQETIRRIAKRKVYAWVE
jgi:Mor family transcriptional regulator